MKHLTTLFAISSALVACSDAPLPSADAAITDVAVTDAARVAEGSIAFAETVSAAALTASPIDGALYVSSGDSGRIYRASPGAATFERFADFTADGLSRAGHLTVTPDGATLLVLTGGGLGAPGTESALFAVDLATRRVTARVALPAASGGLPSLVQDVAASSDSARAYVTHPLENVITEVDLRARTASRIDLGAEFPRVANTNQGFLNASGVAATDDGRYLIVAHLIDKRLYRVSLDAATRGAVRRIDTGSYNVSGNGLWLRGRSLLEVAGDELFVYRFTLDADFTRGTYERRYRSDALASGTAYAVSHGGRVFVLSGSASTGAITLPMGDGGLPPFGDGGLPPFGDGGLPPFGDGGPPGFPMMVGADAGPRAPQRVVILAE